MSETHTHYTVHEVVPDGAQRGGRYLLGSFPTLEAAKELISDLQWDNVVIAKVTTEFLD